MSTFDTLFNLGERGPGKPLAGILRVPQSQSKRFGAPIANGNMRNPIIGTHVAGGKLALARRKV